MKKNRLFFLIISLALMALIPSILIAQQEIKFQTHQFSNGGPDDLMMSKTCKGCHPAIYAEWTDSVHANSSFVADTLHNAMKMAFEHSQVAKNVVPGYFCAHCHTPMVTDLVGVISGEIAADPEDPRIIESIGCHFCHSVESVHDGIPSKYYVLDPVKKVTGPRYSDGTTPFHEIIPNPSFETDEICSGCHGYLMNEYGVEICSLKKEEWDGKSMCQDCHMPAIDGSPAIGSSRMTHHSHKLPGPRDENFLKTAATLSVNLNVSDDTINAKFSIINNTSHKIPSTMPLRMVVLKVVGMDSEGNVVWENFKENPMAEDPQSVFIKVFAAGETVGVPTWDADRIAMDTRIPTGDPTVREYNIPKGKITQLKATLLYFPVPPPAIEQFKLEPDGYFDVPHEITSMTATIGESQ